MKAVIVGGGPIGCLLAVGLQKRSFEVVIYEKGDDPRRSPNGRRHSFNLTLSRRGLSALPPELAECLYACGVRLSNRVIHHSDGRISTQPYGTAEEHHLLSIPRGVLHASFIQEAERAGAALRFRHECLRANPDAAGATFASQGMITEDSGDLLVGADGANSLVRQEMAQSAGLSVTQERIDHGYMELAMPARKNGLHPLAAAARNVDPRGATEGFHIWPRGEFMLIAQPNLDGVYTTTLFLPYTSNHAARASFAQLGAPDRVAEFFCQNFPDVIGLLPRLAAEFHTAPPGPLKTVRCSAFHCRRAVLVGDAAHTILPFYGQGINCSFEDIAVFFALLDQNLLRSSIHDAFLKTLPQFTAVRKPPCDAIADLSITHLDELTRHTGTPHYQARAYIERELHRRHPSDFTSLYCGVAFSTTPYDQVVERHRLSRWRLDALCEAFDIHTEAHRIIEEYAAGNGREPAAPKNETHLELRVAERKRLLDRTISRILQHQSDLEAGRYPASYVHDSIRVAEYEEGKRLCAGLREDPVPQAGTDFETLLSHIFDRALPCGTTHPHAGFLAHVPSGGLMEGATGEFIAAALNRFAGVWVAAPGLTQIERNVIRWFCALLGYGEGSFGYLTTSGSLANLMGLMCACRRNDESSFRRPVVYVSDQGHFSVRKAARLIGIPASQTRVVRTRSDLAMNPGELARQIESDLREILDPACVVATAGTTNTGAIDDLVTLAALCRQAGIWLHVDACFGGFFRMTARGRDALRGIEQADSIAVDAHKSLFLPHGNSALLVKEKQNLRATFAAPDAAYLPGSPLEPELDDFCDYGPELSREIRGLTAWLPIKMHGIAAFRECLDEKLDLAEFLDSQLEELPSIEVVRKHRLLLPVVTFKLRAGNQTDDARLNERLCELICSNGRVYVTTTTLPDCGTVVRACILNHRTNRATVENLVADVRLAIQTLAGR